MMTIIKVIMAKEQFTVIYAAQTKKHLRSIERRLHALIHEAVEIHLIHEPLTESRNRKPLRSPILEADWELRCGPDNRIRVLYTVNSELLEVRIAAVGIKERNRLIIAGEELEP
jgi:hypothetical protein